MQMKMTDAISCQNGDHWENKRLKKNASGNGMAGRTLVHAGAANVEISMELPQRLTNLPSNPVTPLWAHTRRNPEQHTAEETAHLLLHSFQQPRHGANSRVTKAKVGYVRRGLIQPWRITYATWRKVIKARHDSKWSKEGESSKVRECVHA